MTTISWSGRTWTVRAPSTGTDPGPNAWSDSAANVSVDSGGNLLLSIVWDGAVWRCAEIDGPQLGYGKYEWVLNSDPTGWDSIPVLGMFTYDFAGSGGTYFAENDIEVSLWNSVSESNRFWFTVQPGLDRLVAEFPATPKPPYVCTMIWQAGQLYTKVVDVTGAVVGEHLVTAGVQAPGTAQVVTNLWLSGGLPPARGLDFTVSLASFTFTAGATHTLAAASAYAPSLAAASSPASSFPAMPLATRVDLQIDGVWKNITSDVLADARINISRGRQDEASSPEASSATLTVKNSTGTYTPKNAGGTYYPWLGRNAPIRIGVGVPPNGTATGTQSGTAIVAPAVAAESAGIAFAVWAAQSNTVTLTTPAGYTAAAAQVGASVAGLTTRTGYLPVGAAGTVAAATATASVSVSGAAASLFIPGATSIVSTVQGNGLYAFTNSGFGSEAAAGSVTVSAGDVLVALAVWSADARNAMICSPIDTSQSVEWTLVADSGGSTAGPRTQAWARYCPVADTFTVSFPSECYGANDTQLTLYQVRGATSWNPRYAGACSEFATTWDLSGNDVRCAITAGSVLRQRGQGIQAPGSAFYRYLLDRAPLAYWPLETGPQGGVFGSPIPGVVAAIPQPGLVTPGADATSFLASDALPQTAAAGNIVFPVGSYAYALANGGAAFFAFNLTGLGTANSTMWSMAMRNDGTSATISSVALQYVSPTSLNFLVLDGAAAATGTPTHIYAVNIPNSVGWTSAGSLTGVPFGFFLSWCPTPGAPTTQTNFRFALVTTNGVVSAGGTTNAVTGTWGQVYRLGAGIDQYANTALGAVTTWGHMMFDPSASGVDATVATIGPSRVFPSYLAANLVGAFPSEPVSLRLRRVCQDESIPLSTPILTSESADTIAIRHGPQAIHNGMELIALTVATDGGELTEARGFAGLAYRPLGSLGSRVVVQVLDYTGKMITEPFAPADDDQLTVNDVTVTQENGSSARVFLASGPLSIQPPPLGVGTYADSVTVDVAQQGRDLQQIAAWRLSMGTCDAQRFKAIRSLLQAVPASVTGLSLLDVGNHVQVANTPGWVQPGPSDLLIVGLRETIGPVAEWEITYAARPYGPLRVTRPDGGDAFARLDSASSTLSATIASGAASMVVTTANPMDMWGTSNPPFDLLLSGERMTVTAIANDTSGSFESGVAGWNPTGCTAASSTAQFHSGTHSLLMTVTGTPSQAFVRPAGIGVIAGWTYTATMWVFSTSPVANVLAAIDWYDANANYLDSAISNAATIPANTWTRLAVTGPAVAGAVSALVGPTISGSPAAGTLLWLDDVVRPIQTFTVTRSVNGVVKAQPAGTPVHVYYQTFVGLNGGG